MPATSPITAAPRDAWQRLLKQCSEQKPKPTTRDSTTTTDVEDALAMIEDGVKVLRTEWDELDAHDIQQVVDRIRGEMG